MLNPIVGMALPALGVILTASKIPPKWKRQFFKIPIWLSSTLVAWRVGHMFTGVLAPYAMFTIEAVLLPTFWLMKKLHEKKYGKIEPIKLPILDKIVSFFKNLFNRFKTPRALPARLAPT